MHVAESAYKVQVLQQSASHLLMAILEGLLGPYPIGQYSPVSSIAQGSSQEASAHAPPVEAWCTSSSADSTNAKIAPQWHSSSSEEVHYAQSQQA